MEPMYFDEQLAETPEITLSVVIWERDGTRTERTVKDCQSPELRLAVATAIAAAMAARGALRVVVFEDRHFPDGSSHRQSLCTVEDSAQVVKARLDAASNHSSRLSEPR